MAHTRGVKGEEKQRHMHRETATELSVSGCFFSDDVLRYNSPISFMTRIPSLKPLTAGTLFGIFQNIPILSIRELMINGFNIGDRTVSKSVAELEAELLSNYRMNKPAYYIGKIVGNLLSLGKGYLEIGTGLGTSAVAALAVPVTGGTSAVAVPVSLTLVADGVMTTMSSVVYTAEDMAKLVESVGSGGGGSEKVPEDKGEGDVRDSNKLPNAENATINPKKLTEYALNPDHPVGGNKAKVFERVLGYNQSNADDLMSQIYEKLPQSDAILGKVDEYGQRYTVDMPITGANGEIATVRTGWIIRPGSTIPELTTLFVK